MPPGTADAVAYLMKRCGSIREAQRTLELAHPMVMENVRIVRGTLKLRNPDAHWVRRTGWHQGRVDNWRD